MTLEQKRAAAAFRDVESIARQHGEASVQRQQYAAMAQKLPVLIRSSGLCQALHFLKSRTANGERTVLGQLLAHLAAQLQRTDPQIRDGATLCTQVREAPLSTYLWMTREALATAEWYARLAQSELGVERGTEPGERP